MAAICLFAGACAAPATAPADAPDWNVIRAELSRRAAEDQVLRKGLMESGPEAMALLERVEAVDAGNRAWLQSIVDKHGWPGISRVGAKGAHEAWLLVQHADADPAFQERCLVLLRAAVPAGEADGKDLAYLEDRVAVAQGRPQVYGTQFHEVGGVMVPRPMIEPDKVDERRAAVGLGALAEYAEQIHKAYGK